MNAFVAVSISLEIFNLMLRSTPCWMNSLYFSKFVFLVCKCGGGGFVMIDSLTVARTGLWSDERS